MIGGYSAQEAEGLNERMAAINLRDEQTRQMNQNYMIDAAEI